MSDIQTPGLSFPLGLRSTDPEADPRRPIGMFIAPPKGAASKEIGINSIEFVNHTSLLDNAENFESEGTPYPAPHWEADGSPAGHPVSYKMGKHVEVIVRVRLDGPIGARSVSVAVFGEASNGMEFKSKHVTVTRGHAREIRVKSDKPLPRTVGRVQFDVKWHLFGPKIAAMAPLRRGGAMARDVESKNEIFVTMNTPATVPLFLGITHKRMAHSIDKVAGARSLVPNTIVKHLMRTFPVFQLGANPENAWRVGAVGASADCRTIVRYVINILKMVGCPGEAECVLVYEKLIVLSGKTIKTMGPDGRLGEFRHLTKEPTKWDFNVVDEPPPDTTMIERGGLDRPTLVHPNGKWTVILFDGGDGQNAYEACLKFTPPGSTKSKFHAGGVKEFNTIQEVIGVFTKLSWAEYDKTKDKMVPVKNIKTY